MEWSFIYINAITYLWIFLALTPTKQSEAEVLRIEEQSAIFLADHLAVFWFFLIPFPLETIFLQ